jgi:hypothetical protein
MYFPTLTLDQFLTTTPADYAGWTCNSALVIGPLTLVSGSIYQETTSGSIYQDVIADEPFATGAISGGIFQC